MTNIILRRSSIISILTMFIVGMIFGYLFHAERVGALTLPDVIQAISALALSYFAWVQVRKGDPIVFVWAEDWRDIYIENASDYPIFDIYFEYTDIEEKYGVHSDKYKIIHAKKNQKIQLHEKFQGRTSVILVKIQFRTGDIDGTLHERKNEVLLREPGLPF